MDGGIRDDCIYNAFVMQVTSVRGLDVSFVCQYNDAIIFDCITSTKQFPIRFPMPMSRDEIDMEKYFNETEKKIEWEYSLDICRGAVPLKQSMQMDDKGAVYFAIKTETGVVKILRVDPLAEMGNDGFIKSVFSLRCEYIHFLEITDTGFYLMDEKKKIRKLYQDPITYNLKQDNALELCTKDMLNIKYSDFDEFIMSSEVMHWDNRIMFVHETKTKDDYTWGESKIMSENHKFIQGPKVAKGTGMIYYLEKYDNIGNEEDDKDAGAEEAQITTMLNKQATAKDFKGFSVVMKPLADLSYLDILPKLRENYNNFSSYIDSHHILVRFSGRFLIFHNNGSYIGPVVFEKMEPAFK